MRIEERGVIRVVYIKPHDVVSDALRREELSRVLGDLPGHLVVDLSRTPDGLGDALLSNLVLAWRIRRDRGDLLAVAGATGVVREVFDIVRVPFPTAANVDRAGELMLLQVLDRLDLHGDETAYELLLAAYSDGCYGILCDRLEETGHEEAARLRGLLDEVDPPNPHPVTPRRTPTPGTRSARTDAPARRPR